MVIDIATKRTIADDLAAEKGFSKKEAYELVNCVFETMAEALAAGNTVDINGFGKFVVKEKAARTGLNPVTKEKVEIPAKKAPAFKPAKALKEAVK